MQFIMQMIFKPKNLVKKDRNYKQVVILLSLLPINRRQQLPNKIKVQKIFIPHFKAINNKILKNILCQQQEIILRKKALKSQML